MICGDMPLVEMRAEREVWVHPSPWNGKERIKGHVSAPLGGIVFLEQGNQNSIARMADQECGIPVLRQFAVRPETEEQILSMAAMTDGMIQSYPVWKLVNIGDNQSTIITAAAFRHSLADIHEETRG